LAIGVLVVTGAGVAHAVGSSLAVSGQSFLTVMLSASGVGLVCWPLAVVSVITASKGGATTAFIAAIVGGLLVVTGFADFGYSQLPFAWPADLDRLLVALTLGGGIGLAFGGWVAMRRNAGQPKR
jgi:hypothetical protein